MPDWTKPGRDSISRSIREQVRAGLRRDSLRMACLAEAHAGSYGRRERRLVRKRGFEPPRPCGHKLLRLARLPVPPLPHRRTIERGPKPQLYTTRPSCRLPKGCAAAAALRLTRRAVHTSPRATAPDDGREPHLNLAIHLSSERSARVDPAIHMSWERSADLQVCPRR